MLTPHLFLLLQLLCTIPKALKTPGINDMDGLEERSAYKQDS